eukprot:EG_transcript_11446
MASAAPTTGADVAAVLDLTVGHWKSAMVHALARFDVCDAIEELADAESGAAVAEAVAQRCGTDPRATYRLLRGASSLGLVVEQPGHRFQLTGAGKVLTAGSPLSAKYIVLHESGRVNRECWLEFDACLQTGQNVIQRAKGVANYWQVLAGNPTAAEVFTRAMTDFSRGEMHTLLEAYDFGGAESFVDVAGGQGLAAQMVLERYPAMRAVVVDMPDVCALAQVPAGLADRLLVAPFDLFEAASYPKGFDIYFLKNVLHDWDDTHCVTILQNVAAAMTPASRVVIVEPGIPAPNVAKFGKLVDLHMLLLVDGAERTREELDQLAAPAGLRVTHMVETPARCIVEMRKL